MSRILVTGANAQLGSELQDLACEYKDHDFFFVTRKELDLSANENIVNFFNDKSFDVIINCAAYTAVDKAESDAELADQVNHQAVKTLAEIAKEKKIKLIHISTDYVFDGKNSSPYLENDLTNAQSVYGKTKLAGENAMQDINPLNSIIIRTSWVYSPYGSNFVKTMLRLAKEKDELGVIFDQVGTPTYARDLAKSILEIIPKIQNSKLSIYNYSNEGVCSWYDFAQTIFELTNIQCKVNPIETKDYPTPATRPHYSLLNKNKIKEAFDIEVPYWKDSLKECLNVMREVNSK